MKKTIFILFVIIFAVAISGCSERISFENYTVSFDSMGGSAVPESAFSSIKTCPEPLKDGYVFEGWYEESDFSSKMVQFPYEATKNVTLYAKYIDLKKGNEEIKYALEGDGAVAVTYTGSSKNVVIPDFFEGKSVVKVASGFVKNVNVISRFYFGSELKSIEEKFFIFPNFEEFVSLGKNEYFSVIDGILYSGTGDDIICFPRAKAPSDGEFSLPESVESIVKNAFRYADNIRVLNFGKNVRVIEENFSYLSSLERINVDNEFFLSDDGVLYDASGKNLIACPPNRVGSYTLKNSAERIFDGALNGCRLEKLTVNASLEDFGTQENMSGMKSFFCDGNPIFSAIDGVLYDVVSKKIVAYPADKEGDSFYLRGVETVGKNAFYNCKNLKKITVCAEVKTVSQFAFAYSSVENIVFEEYSALEKIDSTAFLSSENLEGVTLSSAVPPVFDCDEEVDFYFYVPPYAYDDYVSAWPNQYLALKKIG